MRAIHLFCWPVPNPQFGRDVIGVAACEYYDGLLLRLCAHISSNEQWSRHDMGFDVINGKHSIYHQMRDHEGYELLWHGEIDADTMDLKAIQSLAVLERREFCFPATRIREIDQQLSHLRGKTE